MANGNNNFNLVNNWGLYCFEQKVNDAQTVVTLRCTMKRKRKDKDGKDVIGQDGKPEYTEPMWIDVMCMLDRCEIAQDDYSKNSINVDGQFAIDEWFSEKENKYRLSYKIWASKVTKVQRG